VGLAVSSGLVGYLFYKTYYEPKIDGDSLKRVLNE